LIFDIQGWITFILGRLLALITLFSSYSHVHVPFAGIVALDLQVGVLLLVALVPALLDDAELATRRRLRAERDRVQEAEDRARAKDEAARERNRVDQERNRGTEERERSARSDRVQARALRAGALVQLEPSVLHRRFLALITAELAQME
jgi:hypothetical protein